MFRKASNKDTISLTAPTRLGESGVFILDSQKMLSLSPGPKAKKNCQNLKLRGYFRVPTNFLKTEVGGGGRRIVQWVGFLFASYREPPASIFK